jgi:AcrR family transcriptional regulator
MPKATAQTPDGEHATSRPARDADRGKPAADLRAPDADSPVPASDRPVPADDRRAPDAGVRAPATDHPASTAGRPGPAGDITRRRLLEATAALIAERGWGAATTRAVAERADVNQALVHYHFGSVGKLRRESVMARLMPEIEGLAEELLDERPIPESIHRVMGRVDRFGPSSETGVLMAEALLQATRDPAMTEAMGAAVGSWSAMLGPRLALAQLRGVVRDDVPAERLAALIASFLDGFLIQRLADPDLDATSAAETLNRLLEPPGEVTS